MKEADVSLIQIEVTHKTATIRLHIYLQNTKDWVIELKRKGGNSKKLSLIAKEN